MDARFSVIGSKEKISAVFLFEGSISDTDIEYLRNNGINNFYYLGDFSSVVSNFDVSRDVSFAMNKIKFVEESEYSSFFKKMKNMFALYLHPFIYKLTVLRYILLEKNITELLMVSKNDFFFDFPERPDVNRMLVLESCFYPLINDLCANLNITVSFSNNKKSTYVFILHRFRSLLLNFYKFTTILFRKFKTESKFFSSNRPQKKIGIIIRAQSEYWTVKPVLKQFEKYGFNPVIIQDDLIKNPSSKAVLDSEGVDYVHIHSKISYLKLFTLWLSSSIKFFKAKRYLKNNVHSEKVENSIEGLILNENRLSTLLASSFHSLPEISVYEHELMMLQNEYNFDVVITMDMVDQWAASLGYMGKQLNFKTIIIQNTVLDKIYYPIPVLTDYFIANGKFVEELLSLSNPKEGSVVYLGSPLQDGFYSYYKKLKKNDGVTKILIATQPFVQNYDYNETLLRELLNVLSFFEGRFELIIKPHPREKVDYYSVIKSLDCGPDVEILISSQDDILKHAEETSLFLSRTSTAIQSFVLMGIPVVSYLESYPADICSRLDYLESSCTVKCFNQDELKIYINEFLNNYEHVYSEFVKNRKSYIEEYVGLFDGKASERIVAFIEGERKR